MLVGDTIMAARRIIPDYPQTMPSPTGIVAALFAIATTLPAGAYYLKLTTFTAWGETLPSAEQGPFAVDATHGIQLTGSMPIGATKIRVYFGIGAGAEQQYVDITHLPANITTTGIIATPPARNRAFLPDTDGNYAGAADVFSWLNDALRQAGKITGGILDVSGVSTIVGNPYYMLFGQWRKITAAWFDGWNVDFIGRRDVFYRNRETSITRGLLTDRLSSQSMIETYPTPDRTGGATIAPGPIAAGDTVIAVQDTSSFLLPYGLILLNGTEIAAYQSTDGTHFSGLMRGLGGTVAVNTGINISVVELNLRFSGYRYSKSDYAPGDSLLTLDVPPDWEVPLQQYLESRYREVEKQYKVASDLRNDFVNDLKAWAKSNRQQTGPVQVGGSLDGDTYGRGLGGRWVIP